MTDINTMILLISMMVKDLKIKYIKMEEAKMDRPKKMYISLTMRLATTTRIWGSRQSKLFQIVSHIYELALQF